MMKLLTNKQIITVNVVVVVFVMVYVYIIRGNNEEFLSREIYNNQYIDVQTLLRMYPELSPQVCDMFEDDGIITNGELTVFNSYAINNIIPKSTEEIKQQLKQQLGENNVNN